MKRIALDGVRPSKSTLRDGTYKPRRPLDLLASATGTPKAGITALLAYLSTPDAIKIMEKF